MLKLNGVLNVITCKKGVKRLHICGERGRKGLYLYKKLNSFCIALLVTSFII